MQTRRKIEQHNIRKLSKVANGDSYAITLPAEIIRKFGWQEHQKLKLDINESNQEITIRDWQE